MTPPPQQLTADECVARALDLLERLERKPLENILSLARPRSASHAATLGRVLGKASAIVANHLEYDFAEFLNEQAGWPEGTEWVRQDPEFPDVALRNESGKVLAGIEIKAWFPLSTEMTGRFRESQNRLGGLEIHAMAVAWLPEFILYGRPQIVDIWAGKASGIAESRDLKYHKPPWYLVIEPGDTAKRTRNLQQTNCAGYVFQGTPEQHAEAEAEVEGWDPDVRAAFGTPEHTALVRDLMARYAYRLDTNFSKMDRVDHAPLEQFKSQVLATVVHGRAIGEWRSAVKSRKTALLEDILALDGSSTLGRRTLAGFDESKRPA